MKTTLLIEKESGEIRFEYIEEHSTDDSIFKLVYHPQGKWTDECKNKSAAQLLDGGDGISITLFAGKKKVLKLDYHELECLQLLLSTVKALTSGEDHQVLVCEVKGEF